MGAGPLPFEVLQLTDGDSAFRHSVLDPQQLALFPIGPDHAGSSVVVLRLDDLTALLQSLPHGLIVDRGTKHHAKPLSSYLTRHGELFAIRAPYRNAGQAGRGLRALLDAAARYKNRACCFVAVNGPVFDALAHPVRSAAPTPGSPSETPEYLRVMLDDSVPVPDSLTRAYLGEGAQVEWVRRSIVLAARTDHPVLIQGETGTGKEVVARRIHLLSRRGAETFVPVNCGGIPSDLFESELFGHVRGSFTGATRDKKGLWTLADKGTLFLDEIGDLPLDRQVKVLRALEDGRYFPIGSEEVTRSQARIIAATNLDLAGMVRSGQFREDLYYRLFTFRIRTPALREHPRDIPQIARHFWAKIGDGSAPPLTQAVTDALALWHWPGNARELRSFLINVLLLANGRKIDAPLVRAVMRDRLGSNSSKAEDL